MAERRGQDYVGRQLAPVTFLYRLSAMADDGCDASSSKSQRPQHYLCTSASPRRHSVQLLLTQLPGSTPSTL